MEGYLTVGEAAEKWGVSEGRICQYCLRGRIPGAKRLGGAWVIPESADRPSGSQPAKPGKTPELFSHLMPLMNTPFAPGQCRQAIADMKAGPKRDIALAEYHYFSGQAEKAMTETERYLTAKNGAIRLSACWLYAFACLTMGRPDHARHALREIQSTLESGGEAEPALRAAQAFVAFGAAVLLHLPLPEEMPPAEDFLPLLPPGLRAFALYVQAHYLYLKGEYGRSVGVVEATIKPEWPEDFRRIIDITYRFSSGWRRVHNPVTGHDVADDLTTTEFAIAMLAARGWTTQEIGDHLNVSANTVKAHISQAMKKLNVKNRKDLKKHMLR